MATDLVVILSSDSVDSTATRTRLGEELANEVGLVTYWRTAGQWGDFVRPVGNDDFTCV